MQIIILIAFQTNDTFRFHLKLDLSIMRSISMEKLESMYISARKLRSALAEAIGGMVKICSSTDTFGSFVCLTLKN
ncbi:hypothetical protein T05_3623 [Trichinella murrelli]|uniref:Uncharacterized protein n=1 Tax=Trichinella murrelli TaxID=144512 RepID=A0A0V0TZL3_9BILA|nr:hypothetical protein T05_3623 [Trichinella murrelli]